MVDRIEILDTTLRDGEQTSGVSFTVREKLSIARLLLDELHVDRIEVASARVSDGEFESVRRIARWAEERGFLDRVEVLGFVDGGVSLRWIADAGCRVMNLLAKGSLRHCELQLRKTPEQHVADICEAIEAASAEGIAVNLYLEDWSNGMRFSKDYVYGMIDALRDRPIARFMIPDTLACSLPTTASVLPRDGRALSGTAFRLPCPQRLRFGRGECHGRCQGGRTGNPYDRQRAGGAGRATRPCRALRLC